VSVHYGIETDGATFTISGGEVYVDSYGGDETGWVTGSFLTKNAKTAGTSKKTGSSASTTGNHSL